MRKNEGITLIALIITIIILIILTAITINNVIGTDLIGFATKAAENYIDAEKEEEEAIDKLVDAAENLGISKDSKVKAGEIVTETVKDNYTDAEGRTATIPQGFKVSTKQTEQLIDDGLVIQDNEGNEFVWIPCTEEQYTEAKNDVIDEDWVNYMYKEYGSEEDWRDNFTAKDKIELDKIYTGENSLPVDDWINENQTEIGRISISAYGGFYIARYEAGVPENASFYVPNKENEYKYVNIEGDHITVPWGAEVETTQRGNFKDTAIIKNLKPISKQGVQAWNYITQPNAKLISENMYKDSLDRKGNKVGVKSYLVDSQVWNHICKNIYKAKKGQDANNSTNWGNYYHNTTTDYKRLNCLWANHISGNPYQIATEYKMGAIQEDNCPATTNDGKNRYLELSTGASEEFKKYNIYDMAGNLAALTTEHCIYESYRTPEDRYRCVSRGESFAEPTYELASVVAAYADQSLRSSGVAGGFRVVLYINEI